MAQASTDIQSNKTQQRLAEVRQAGMHKRQATVAGCDVEKRTVELSFSSEEEYERYWGIEVLSHDSGAVIMGRLHDGAPLLWNHNRDDMRGVVESARIDADRKGRACVRLSRSPDGEKLLQDIADKIVTKVSVGYMIHSMKLVEERKNVDVYRIDSWEPYEISMVSIPADNSVGVGRGAEILPQEPKEPKPDTTISNNTAPKTREIKVMDEEEKKAKEALEKAARAAGAGEQQQRIAKITAIGEQFKCADLAMKFLSEGKSAEELQAAILEDWEKKSSRGLSEQSRDANLGMSDKDADKFSIVKAVRALAEPTDSAAQKAAAFEFEASREAQKRMGRDSEHFMIPSDVLVRSMNTGLSGMGDGDTGGFLINSGNAGMSMIDMIRKKAILMQYATVIGGLVGNVEVPVQTRATNATWIGEDEDADETDVEFGQMSFNPKTIAAHTAVGRKLLKQSSIGIEMFLRQDLTRTLALGIDRAGYYGKGSEKMPMGLFNTPGIGVVPFATAGKPSYAELVAMETKVQLADADVDSMIYMGDAHLSGHAKTTLKFPGDGGSNTIWEDGKINSYRARITNQIDVGDVAFGNFIHFLMLLWGGMELHVDPYSGSRKGLLKITVFQDIDMGVRYKQAFAIGRKP